MFTIHASICDTKSKLYNIYVYILHYTIYTRKQHDTCEEGGKTVIELSVTWLF